MVVVVARGKSSMQQDGEAEEEEEEAVQVEVAVAVVVVVVVVVVEGCKRPFHRAMRSSRGSCVRDTCSTRMATALCACTRAAAVHDSTR